MSVGFAAHTIRPEEAYIPWESQERRNREMLSHALNLRDTVFFVGSGCSIPLGYPNWQQLAEKAINFTEERFGGKAYSAFLAKCKEAINSRNRATELSFVLGACENVWKQEEPEGGALKYREKLCALFDAKTTKRRNNAVPDNPYEHLLELPVRRFVTSNYDCALEHIMVKKFGLQLQDYVPGHGTFGRKSFTQDDKYDEQLAIFAMAYAEHDRKVFHCHGWHHEPESMVLTESDYQRWYLKDQFVGTGRFRQTIDLIFGSNPILFVGFGLRDDDLLSVLRMFSAIEPHQKHSRPLFALLEKDEENYAESTFEQLYERYGIHVVSYSRQKATRAAALCKAIDRIGRDCKEHRAQWLQKPKLKKIQINAKQPDPYFHYQYVSVKHQDASQQIADPLLDELYKEVDSPNPAKVIVLLGPGGTGKSWAAMQLLSRLAALAKSGVNHPHFSGLFFWSSYYTDDALNGTDRALQYLQARESTKSRVDRLLECLTNTSNKYILVFDGVERFLEETGQPGVVRSNSGLVSRFFRAITNPESKSIVILTSRMMPREFSSIGQAPGDMVSISSRHATLNPLLKVIPVQGFSVEQVNHLLKMQGGYHAIRKDQVPSLVSWLDGHRYGITLAVNWLQGYEREHPGEAFKQLRHHMAQMDPEQRVSRMIGLCLEALKPPARQLLEKLAIFMSPINHSLVKHCLGDAGVDLETVLRQLTDGKVLFQVAFEERMDHYVVHPTVREYVFHRLHNSSTRDLPNLTLSGYTSGSDPVYPGDAKGVEAVTSLFKSLHAEAEKCANSNDPVSRKTRGQACRDVFSVLRSRMAVNAVSRWITFEGYLGYLASVIDLARKVSPGNWDYAVKDPNRQPQVFEDVDGPLYSEEVAWLYNEAGLAYYSEGSMLDAIAVWEQGYEINKLLDSEPEGGQYLFQSLCNLGASNINFGRLRTAHAYLKRALELGLRLGDDDHCARVEGYIALVCHLQGNLAEADDRYKAALEKLHKIGNMRAESIFLLHYGSLLIRTHTGAEAEMKEAAMKIQSARALAEAGNYPDLVAYARLSQGHIHRSQKEYSESIRHYRIALAEARQRGIGRLEAEAQSELARVALDLGDAQVARRRAMKALQIANEHTLGLRQTHGMLVLGKATLHAGERELGIYYLKHARRLAERQEYRLRGNEAEAALHACGEPVDALEADGTTSTFFDVHGRAAGA